jgi:hypothetical protein
MIAFLLSQPPVLFTTEDFTSDSIASLIRTTVEVNLAVMNAAYPGLLAFVSNTTTGFMNTAPADPSLSRNSGKDKICARMTDPLGIRVQSGGDYKAAARAGGENVSLRSFDSQAIMISKPITLARTGEDLF